MKYPPCCQWYFQMQFVEYTCTDGLVQDCSISSASAMYILQSYTNPLIIIAFYSFFPIVSKVAIDNKFL